MLWDSREALLMMRSRFSIQPLTILGVTGPFAVLAENIYELCESSFHVSCSPHNLKKTD